MGHSRALQLDLGGVISVKLINFTLVMLFISNLQNRSQVMSVMLSNFLIDLLFLLVNCFMVSKLSHVLSLYSVMFFVVL
jgi:hypothetical protein